MTARSWFTSSELAERFGVSKRTIERLRLAKRRRRGKFVLLDVAEAEIALAGRGRFDRNWLQHRRGIPLAGRPIPLAGRRRVR